MDTPTGKRCTKCGETKPLDEFGRHRSRPDGLRSRCRECEREAVRRRHAANREAEREYAQRRREGSPEAVREVSRRYREQNREAMREGVRRRRAANPEAAREADRRRDAVNRKAVFDHYGRSCACCGSTDRLTLDHVNGDGKAHREAIGGSGATLYRWLVARGFPVDPPLQVLCSPCNQSKSNTARCRLDHQAAEAAAA